MSLPVFVSFFVYILRIAADIPEGPLLLQWNCQIECSFSPWEEWSSCTATCGGGTQSRFRSATQAISWECIMSSRDCRPDIQSCNTQCFNGGTFLHVVSDGLYSSYCSCPAGKKGSCCLETVNCGEPSAIGNGNVIGSNYEYGHHVTYTCDSGYNMTDPSASSRTCSDSGYWTGVTPTCLYARSCDSSPCENGGTCTNGLDFYTCVCEDGWIGKKCEIDVQPPVLSGCSANRSVNTSVLLTNQNWTVPNFTDPMGTPMTFTSNYDSNSYNFPWGDFTIHYSATRQVNGLTTDCVFTISVRPYPCPPILAPKHGAVVCNGWRKDFARVCIFNCLDGFTYPPGYSSDNWYTCGSSGNWLPPSMLTECIPDALVQPSSSGNQMPNMKDCNNASTTKTVQSHYIEALKASEFNQLCQDFLPHCFADNVDIMCMH